MGKRKRYRWDSKGSTNRSTYEQGLQSLKDDPRVQAAHDKIVEDIRDIPEYKRNEPFVIEEEYGNESFQAMGNNENWREAAWEGNQAFMVYTGTLSATNTSVSTDGTISTTWRSKFLITLTIYQILRTGALYITFTLV